MLSVTADGTTTNQTMNMSYNDGGGITSLVYPDGETITSQYDVNGRFQNAYFGTPSTPDPVNFLVGQTGYTGSGQLSSLAIGGSGPKSGTPTPVFTLSIGYDGIQRPQSTSATVGSSTIWSQGRTYDNVGNVLQLATTVPSVGGGTLTDNQSFCYDALSRLMWAGNSGTPTGGDHCGNAPTGTTLSTYQQSFSYDSLDRMASGPAGSVTYGDINHVHAATTLGSMPNPYAGYDAMGNMTCRNIDTTTGHTCGSSPTGALMSYDNEGRLASWTAPSGTTATDSFLYDNEGNRVLQRVNTGTVTDTITFDGYTETVLSGGMITPTKYYNVNGQRVAMKTNSTLSYLLSDELGSSTIVLTSTGATQAVQLFAPYGSIRYSQGTMPTTYNFTGQRLDSQTGLLYYGSRYYDPVSGRFVRADTTQTNAGGMDPYAYVGENPETKNDPTGSRACDISGDCAPLTSIVSPSSPSSGPNALPKPTTNTVTLLNMCSQNPRCAAAFRDFHNRLAQEYLSVEFGIFAGAAELVAAFLTDDPEIMQQDEEDLQKLSDLGIEGETFAKALGCSFTSDTLVRTKHALQPIGKLHIGDKVLAYNPKTHKMELEPVLHVWINHDTDLVDLTLTTTTPAGHGKAATKTSETIHTNQKHPFFTKEEGFLPVGRIKLGMHVLRADGIYGVVTGWKIVPGTKTMYNLEVARDHTFMVGTGEWVVHNTCNPTDEELLTAYETVSNKEMELEAEAGLLARMYSRVLKFREPVVDENGVEKGELDVETPGAIIEAKSGNTMKGQLTNLQRYLTDPYLNPSKKPVIVYAPNIGQRAAQQLTNMGFYVAQNQDQLIIWVTLFQ